MLEIRVSNLKLLLAPKAGKTKMKQIDALKTKQINDFFFLILPISNRPTGTLTTDSIRTSWLATGSC